MDFVTIFGGGTFVAILLFVASTVSGLCVTGIVGSALPTINKRQIAFLATGAFPVMMTILVMVAITDKAQSGQTEVEALSLPLFATGAILALVGAWPLSYLCIRRLYSLKSDKSE